MSAAKRIKLDQGGRAGEPASGPGASATTNFGSLSVDTVAIVFGYLCRKDILRARVCKTFREAAARTPVPLSRLSLQNEFPDFCVNSLRRYEALKWMSRALPNLQEIYFHKAVMSDLFFEDGENSAPDAATAVRRRASGLPTRRIDIIASTFPRLRRLGSMGIHSNGSYPRLLDFPRLQNLLLLDVEGLELDLETIARSLLELKD